MNEIIQSLLERKSVRIFEDRPVAPEIKNLLLEATIQAPSAGNQLLYSIIDVTDPELKKTLCETCDNQGFIATAPLVFVFVADHTRWHEGFAMGGANPRPLGVGDLMLAVTDTAIAAQNMVVAAESLGLGSCYIGDVLEQCEKHRALFSLPVCAVPVCMLVLGYPTEQQKARQKPPRFGLEYLVGENTYPHLSQTQLKACFADQFQRKAPHSTRTVEEELVAFCTRKYHADFSLEMTRSVAEYLKSFQQDEDAP